MHRGQRKSRENLNLNEGLESHGLSPWEGTLGTTYFRPVLSYLSVGEEGKGQNKGKADVDLY